MPELFSEYPGAFVAVGVVFGLLIGSFLNVVWHRLPVMLERDWREQCAWLEGREPEATPTFNLLVPRSACPLCSHAIAWYENIPLLSWVFLRGRCSNCGQAISLRYALVESATACAFGLAALQWGYGIQAIAAWCLIAALIVLTVIDLDTQLLPDIVTLPLAWLGLLVNVNGLFAPLPDAVLGGVFGYLSLWTVYHLFRLLTGKEGMGQGDFKLLCALGAWLGWKLLLPIVLIASLGGAVLGIVLILFSGHERSQPMPFGPWLALGGIVALFHGEVLLALWLG